MIELLDDVAQFVMEVLELFGLPALFAVFVLKGALIGKFFPTSVFLPGYVIATGAALLDAAVIIAVVTLAHILGQLVVFAGCRRYGRPFLDRLRTSVPNSNRNGSSGSIGGSTGTAASRSSC